MGHYKIGSVKSLEYGHEVICGGCCRSWCMVKRAA